MTTPRYSHTATVLSNGKVLLTGGLDSGYNVLSSAELFDPSTGTFISTASLNTGRYAHSATLLNSGKVLITGGYDSSGNLQTSAELYDPASGTFSPTGSLSIARYEATATLLNTGKVIFAGGLNAAGQVLASSEIYDPVAGTSRQPQPWALPGRDTPRSCSTMEQCWWRGDGTPTITPWLPRRFTTQWRELLHSPEA